MTSPTVEDRVLAYDVLTEENDRLLTHRRFHDGTADITYCRGPSTRYAKLIMERLGLAHRDMVEARRVHDLSHEQAIAHLNARCPGWRNWLGEIPRSGGPVFLIKPG